MVSQGQTTRSAGFAVMSILGMEGIKLLQGNQVSISVTLNRMSVENSEN